MKLISAEITLFLQQRKVKFLAVSRDVFDKVNKPDISGLKVGFFKNIFDTYFVDSNLGDDSFC